MTAKITMAERMIKLETKVESIEAENIKQSKSLESLHEKVDKLCEIRAADKAWMEHKDIRDNNQDIAIEKNQKELSNAKSWGLATVAGLLLSAIIAALIKYLF